MNVYKIKIQFLLKLLILQYMQCAVPQEQSALTAPVSNLEQLFRTIVALYNQPNALEEAQNKVKELEKRVRALTKEIEEERGVEIFLIPNQQTKLPPELAGILEAGNFRWLARALMALYNQPNALEEAQNKVKELEKRVRALTKEIEEERGVEIFYVQPKK